MNDLTSPPVAVVPGGCAVIRCAIPVEVAEELERIARREVRGCVAAVIRKGLTQFVAERYRERSAK